jgi:hypothetical protein
LGVALAKDSLNAERGIGLHLFGQDNEPGLDFQR